MTSKILQIVTAKHKSSNGHNGTLIVTICNELNITKSELAEIIKELSNQVVTRNGIHGAMLMLKVNAPRQSKIPLIHNDAIGNTRVADIRS